MTNQSRRDLLKKTLAVGAAAYVAPKIVGNVANVSAQQLSGQICPVPDSCETFACFAGACACIPTIGGSTVCVTPTCTEVACVSNVNCPGGQVCFNLGCCGPGSFCVPLCFGGGPAGPPQAPWQKAH